MDEAKIKSPKFSFCYWYFKINITLLLSVFVGIVFYSLTFYIHEAGHIVFGSLIQLFHLKIPIPVISNWIFLWDIVPLPQQTKVIGLGHSTLFALGGSIFILVAMILIAIRLFNRQKRYTWVVLSLPVIFFMHEVTGNFLFGTDNYLGQPLLKPTEYVWLHYFVPGTLWAIVVIAIPFIWNQEFVTRISIKLSITKG